jgi:hypothetical protein
VVSTHEPPPIRRVGVEDGTVPAVGVAQVLDPVHPKGRRAGAQFAQPRGGGVGHGGHVAVGGHHDHHPVARCHGAGEGATGEQHLIVGGAWNATTVAIAAW